jgi:DNA invertase Pin-like site-specific DNA recombinase
MQTNRVALYARVSKANRTGQTTSVDEQLAVLREVVARHGGTVVAEHTDRAVKASGSAKARPGWDALLADIEAGRVDAVALWEVSRSSRRLAEWATFRDLCVEHGVVWLLPDGVADPAGRDRLSMGVKAVVAEQEVADLTARIRRTVRANATEGRPHGKESYGYRRLYSPATGALVGVEVHPEEAAVIRRLADGVLAGKGLRTLARELNDEGLPCPADAIALRRGREPKGHQWTGRVIRETLQRRTYLGVRTHETRTGRRVEVAEYEAQWPALLTDDEHARLGRILSDPARWTRPDDGGRPEVAHWLSGILRCGKCEGRMRRMKSSAGVEAYLCGDSRCRGCSIDKAKVEQAVEPIILARLGLADATEALAPVEPGADDSQALRDEVAGAEARLAELAEGFAAGLLSLAAYAEAEKALRGRVDAARAALRAVDAPGLPQFASDAPDPAAAWRDWSPAERHMVAGALLDRIIVKPVGRGRPVKGYSVLPRLGFVRAGTVEIVWGVAE